MAALLIPIAGAAIGGVVGPALGIGISAATGAQIGFLAGSFVANFVGQKGTVIEGPRLRDLNVQSSAYGAAIPEIYGTVRMAGNIIWSTGIIETRHEEDVGGGGLGKGGIGGGGATQVTYSYAVSLAVGMCAGEISGIRRIWADSKLIYSIALGATPATFVANEACNATVYVGSETQTADPTIAAAQGAANTPGFRGLAYTVFTTFQLSDFANHIPNFEFEVVKENTQTYPYHRYQGGSPQPTFSDMAVDTRRNRILYVPETNSASGDPFYIWDLTSNGLVEFGEIGTAILIGTSLTSQPSAVYDSVEDRFHILWGASGGNDNIVIQTIDAATGATIYDKLLHINYFGPFVAANGTTQVGGIVNPRGWWYDPFRTCIWGIGSGFTANAYSLKVDPGAGTIAVNVFETIAGGDSGPLNTLFDATGGLWIVAGGGQSYVRFAPNPFETDQDVTLQEDTAFMWSARQEIWTYPSAGGSINGWQVFDIATETAQASTDLVSSGVGVGYPAGVENSQGQAWFFKDSGTGGYLDAILVNPDLSIEKTLTATIRQTDGVQEAYVALPGIIACNPSPSSEWAQCFYEIALEPGTIGLDEVVTHICSEVGLTTIDVTDLASDVVRGYARMRPMTARAALEPLGVGYGFDGVESDATAKFVKRGGSSVATFTNNDLGAVTGSVDTDAGELWTRSEQLETELPRELNINFLNPATNQEPGLARSRRLTGVATNKVFNELPIVFTQTEANQVADVVMRQAWVERVRFTFAVGPKFGTLDPTDVVTLPDDSRVRITRINETPGGVIEIEGASDDQGALSSYLGGNPDERTETITLDTGGPSTIAVIDGPLLRDIDNDVSWVVGACGETSAWPGAVAFESRDGGVTYTGRTAFTSGVRIGRIVSGMMVNPQNPGLWDHASVFTVKLIQSNLTLSAPASEEAFYNGAGAFFVSQDGVTWELAQAYTITDNGDDTYTCQDLLRGRKGTEHNIGPYREGAIVVFVDYQSPRVAIVPADLAQIDAQSLWKAVTSGGSLADEFPKTKTFAAVAATPISPCHVGGGKIQTTGAINCFATRRARKDQNWRSGGGAGLDEPYEEYELELWDEGFGELKRTITGLDTPSYTFSSADQTTYFGGAQDVIGTKWFQISTRVGRGFMGQANVGDVDPPARLSETYTTEFILRHDDRFVTRTGSNTSFAPLNRGYPTGKYYWECLVDITSGSIGSDLWLGINRGNTIGSSYWLFRSNGSKTTSNVTDNGQTLPSAIFDQDVIQFAVDFTLGYGWVGVNGRWYGGDPATGLDPTFTFTPASDWHPCVRSDTGGSHYTVECSFGYGNRFFIPETFNLVS